MKIQWILCFACTCLFADETVEEPLYIQEIHQNFSSTDRLIEQYKDKLNWFFNYTSAEVDGSPIEKDAHALLLKEKWTREHNQFKESVLDALDKFCEFREETARTLADRYHGGTYSHTTYAAALQEMTNWYVNFMEAELFPSNWKNLYEQHQKITLNNPTHCK